MGAFKQFNEDYQDGLDLVWEGAFNRSWIAIYSRSETGAEEIYSHSEDGILQAAIDMAAFVQAATPEDFQAEIDEDDATTVLVSIRDEVYDEYDIETGDDGTQYAVDDIQIDDGELDYLKVNGVLPEVKFGDLDLSDPSINPDDDFWNN